MLSGAPEFAALKAEIESHPRLCGYYILELVSIYEWRHGGVPQETILEKLVDHFDSDPTDPNPNFVPDQEWTDYETTRDDARGHVVESLIGGSQIGHTRETMPRSTAAEFFDRFVAVCGANPRFYIGLGLGDRTYSFQYGALIVADELAGIFWIVEDD
jgi:hypothetical protein